MGHCLCTDVLQVAQEKQCLRKNQLLKFFLIMVLTVWPQSAGHRSSAAANHTAERRWIGIHLLQL